MALIALTAIGWTFRAGRSSPGDSGNAANVRILHRPLRARTVRSRSPATAGRRSRARGPVDGDEISIATPGVRDCDAAGRYRARAQSGRFQLELVDDDCKPRRMILDKSDWRPVGTAVPIAERRITRTRGAEAAAAARRESGGRQLAVVPRPRRGGRRRRRSGCPTNGTVKSGKNILWQAPIPGPRPLEPGDLGRSRLRHERGQQPRQRHVQSRTLRRRRCLGRSIAAQVDGVGVRQADRQAAVGSRRVRRRAGRCAPHQVHLRQRDAGHRRTPRHRVVRLAGRLRLRRERQLPVEGRSRPHPSRRLRHSRASSGDRPARRFSGMVSPFCRSTRMPTRSSSR